MHTARNAGFTLIELIVVMALVSLFLLLTIPRFQDALLTNENQKNCRWIMGTIRDLKRRAVEENKGFALHIDVDTRTFWITDESMSDESRLVAKQDGFVLTESLRVLDVEFPKEEKVTAGRADIFFYKSGYSDKALIHLEGEDAGRLSFLIEPFLTAVKLYPHYAGFNE